MAAWVSVVGLRVPCAFADPPSAPAHADQAASQSGANRAIAPQDLHAAGLDGRASMRPRPRLRPAALLHPRVDASIATFPGFRVLPDGKTQLYVELSRPCSVNERRQGGTLVYVLRGARVVAKNNKNALITTHFPTPMDRARLRSAGEDLEVVIDLRADVSASYEVVPSEGGTARLQVTFPAGSFPPAAPRRFEPGPAQENIPITDGPESASPASGSSGANGGAASDEAAPARPPTTPSKPSPREEGSEAPALRP